MPAKRQKPVDLSGFGSINPPREPLIAPEALDQAVPEPPKRTVDAVMGEKFVKTLFAEARHKALFGGRGSGK